MDSLIHPLACVHPGAQIGENTRIDAFAVIDEHVKIGAHCHIHSHAKIAKYTTIGDHCRIYLGASVGEDPQDHRYDPTIVSYTEIGNYVALREYVTVHRPPFEGKTTYIGDYSLLMAFVHVGHDCKIANHVTIANLTLLAGHVEVESGAVISAAARFHQFCRVGKMSITSSFATTRQDTPPFCMVNDEGYVVGMNAVGMRRAGLSSEVRLAVQRAIRTYFYEDLLGSAAIAKIEETDGNIQEVQDFLTFIKTSTRGIVPGVKKETED